MTDVPGGSGQVEEVDRPVTEALRIRPPRHLVSPMAVRYWTARALVGWLVVVAIQLALLVPAHAGLTGWRAALLAATAVAAAAHLAIMPRWRYRVHRWEATSQAVYTQAGWFSQQRRIAPISRIQTVDTERGPLEQLFGLSNVTVTTASAAGPLKIHGLERDRAQALVDDLTRSVEASRGDAT
ncbi:MAG TPA: PH domain-containing protein [Candidatus Dormibacteraeota bacterium]|nr:PH domain-containing protein [Candidatus Dormibacteraeota bacterium]